MQKPTRNTQRTITRAKIIIFQYLQPFIKYLRVTLVFMQNSAPQKKFGFCFSRVFCYY